MSDREEYNRVWSVADYGNIAAIGKDSEAAGTTSPRLFGSGLPQGVSTVNRGTGITPSPKVSFMRRTTTKNTCTSPRKKKALNPKLYTWRYQKVEDHSTMAGRGTVPDSITLKALDVPWLCTGCAAMLNTTRHTCRKAPAVYMADTNVWGIT